MGLHDFIPKSVASLALVLCVLGLLAAGEASAPDISSKATERETATKTAPPRSFTTETVRGKVVWLDDALERLYGVTIDPAAAKTSVVLQSTDGKLLPIISDTRGRAFMADQRLRDTELELFVRRHAGLPMIQVIRVFRNKPDGKYEIDYWCDVCAISMFILKDCECCQGPTRLREQRINSGSDPAR